MSPTSYQTAPPRAVGHDTTTGSQAFVQRRDTGAERNRPATRAPCRTRRTSGPGRSYAGAVEGVGLVLVLDFGAVVVVVEPLGVVVVVVFPPGAELGAVVVVLVEGVLPGVAVPVSCWMAFRSDSIREMSVW